MYLIVETFLIVLTILYLVYFVLIPSFYLIKTGLVKYKFYKQTGKILTVNFNSCCQTHISHKERYIHYKKAFDNNIQNKDS